MWSHGAYFQLQGGATVLLQPQGDGWKALVYCAVSRVFTYRPSNPSAIIYCSVSSDALSISVHSVSRGLWPRLSHVASVIMCVCISSLAVLSVFP